MAQCRTCGAEIQWATTPQNRPIPLDVGDTPDGNMTLTATGVARPRASDDTSPPRRAHFATCKQADMWRRK